MKIPSPSWGRPHQIVVATEMDKPFYHVVMPFTFTHVNQKIILPGQQVVVEMGKYNTKCNFGGKVFATMTRPVGIFLLMKIILPLKHEQIR